MKKALIVFLILTIILTGTLQNVSYGAGQYDKKLEEAILIVKELFDISDGYDEFNSFVSTSDDEVYFYLSWQDTKEELDIINVNLDGNSRIRSYSRYPSRYKEPEQKLPTFTKKEAEKFALEFVGQIDPDIAKSIRLATDDNPLIANDLNYNFNYNRYINDIPYYQNSISISVNKFTGQISSYYTNWDYKIKFPEPQGIISQEDAIKLYEREIGLKPIFKENRYFPRPLVGKDKWDHYLVYSPFETNKGIDAFTGKVVDLNYFGIYFNESTANVMDSGVMGLTPVEQEAVDKLSGFLEVETLEKKAREILKIEKDYELAKKYLQKSYKNTDDYLWYMYFQRQIEEEKYEHLDVGIDARTGEILSFYKMPVHHKDAMPKLSIEKALGIAEEYVKSMQPDKSNKIEWIKKSIDDNQLAYYFQFTRVFDDVYVQNDNISVGVDGVSGDIYSYNLDWYKGEFPPTDQLISVEKAYETLWGEVGIELNYIQLFDYTKLGETKSEVKLVYSLNNKKPSMISGITGELLDYSGEPFKEVKPIFYIDIDKSYAKDKIETLSQYGIGFEEEEFKPKDKITQRDFIYLLWKSIHQYSTKEILEDEVYRDLISMGYIKEDERNPEAPVTKEEAIKYIIRIMKLDKAASIEGIYKEIFPDFSDIEEGLKGYVNIAYGLKIVIGDGTGHIRPKYELNREDAANMIFNYLFN
ncbi:MAG: S-layer homology domain-containing protein [Tissierellaceae bacterium]|nr:S-layer homology domain-containing protein [Tissierellaceae bacterium]